MDIFAFGRQMRRRSRRWKVLRRRSDGADALAGALLRLLAPLLDLLAPFLGHLDHLLLDLLPPVGAARRAGPHDEPHDAAHQAHDERERPEDDEANEVDQVVQRQPAYAGSRAAAAHLCFRLRVVVVGGQARRPRRRRREWCVLLWVWGDKWSGGAAARWS